MTRATQKPIIIPKPSEGEVTRLNQQGLGVFTPSNAAIYRAEEIITVQQSLTKGDESRQNPIPTAYKSQ